MHAPPSQRSPQPAPQSAATDPVALAAAASRGDRDALERLVRWSGPVVTTQVRRALARHRLGPGAEDVIEEVAAEVQAFLATGRGDGPGWRRFAPDRADGGVEGWLFGIVRNKVRRRVRDARRQQALRLVLAQSERAVAGEAHHGHRHLEARSVERALDGARALRLAAALPARERDALSLWMEDAPSREIAARLRFRSAHAVDCCLTRGKNRLRAMMGCAA